jgi:hypothetical protein
LRISSIFVGIPQARVKTIVTSIEKASEVVFETIPVNHAETKLESLLKQAQVVFLNRHLAQHRLTKILEDIRRASPDLPVVLTYQADPDGDTYLLAARFDCWLFSETDRFGRTLTPAEIGEALKERAANDLLQRRLMEVSLCAGPCSTGG